MFLKNMDKPAPRLNIQEGISYRLNYSRQMARGTLHNISVTGAFLGMEDIEKIKVGQRLVLFFQIGSRSRSILATVIWLSTKGCGLEFQHALYRDMQIVDDFMEMMKLKKQDQKNVIEKIFKQVS